MKLPIETAVCSSMVFVGLYVAGRQYGNAIINNSIHYLWTTKIDQKYLSFNGLLHLDGLVNVFGVKAAIGL